MMCTSVNTNGDDFMLLFHVALYILIKYFELYSHPFVIVVCFVVYVLVGYKYSGQGALATGRLAGGDGRLSSVIILLAINCVVDYVL